MKLPRRLLIYSLVIIIAFWSLLPIYWFLNLSLMIDVETVSVPPHFIPEMPTFANYLRVLGFPTKGPMNITFRPFGYSEFIKRGIMNSLALASVTTIVATPIATTVGYTFARYKFRYKTGLLFTLLFSRALPPVSIVIPYFVLYEYLGLRGTYEGLVILYLSITVPIMTWVLIGFFSTLPVEVERAARIDGCTRLMTLRKIIVPMASSGVAATAILTFLLCWNEFLFAWLLTAGTPVQPLPPVFPGMLYGIIDNTALAAATILSLIPPTIIAIFFGKYIMRLRIEEPITVVTE